MISIARCFTIEWFQWLSFITEWYRQTSRIPRVILHQLQQLSASVDTCACGWSSDGSILSIYVVDITILP